MYNFFLTYRWVRIKEFKLHSLNGPLYSSQGCIKELEGIQVLFHVSLIQIRVKWKIHFQIKILISSSSPQFRTWWSVLTEICIPSDFNMTNIQLPVIVCKCFYSTHIRRMNSCGNYFSGKVAINSFQFTKLDPTYKYTHPSNYVVSNDLVSLKAPQVVRSLLILLQTSAFLMFLWL